MKKLVILILFCILDSKVYVDNNKVFLEKKLKSWLEFKNDNLIRQKYDYSCGSASLGTILKYYYNDNEVSEKKIINEILKSKGYDSSKNEILKEGDNIISFLDLSKYAQDNGFKALGLALDFDSLAKLKIPVIVFISIRNIGHFSVYKGMDKNNVYLADPSFGNIKIRINEFKKMFYQRKNLQYPGKILAIIPQNKNIRKNDKFININHSSNLTHEMIKQNFIYETIHLLK